MKSLNFWRALFVSALALTTFAACSDDDAEGGFKERPEISVNGKTSATVARDLEAGLTEAVEVVSAGPWSVEFDNAADAAWCTPMIDGKATLTSKGGGTSMLTFDLSGTDAARETSFTLIATGELMGYPLTAKATVTVKQNAGGSTAIETNVKAVRDRLTFESTAKTIEESIVLTGIVVSDFVGNNINNHQIMVTDNTTEPGAGLMVRFKGYIGNSKPTDMNLPAGSIVQLELKGGAAQSYNGTYQVNFTDASADPEVKVLSQEGNMPEAITVENPNDLAAYQSQYVQVYSQPTEAVRGTAYYSDAASSGYANKLFQTKNGATFQLSFGSYTSTWAANVTIPSNAGYIKGCVSLNQSVGNISPRNADDLVGMTEELFEVEAAQGTISQITATGEYKVADATVVAVSTRSFIMADATGAFLVYRGSETIPAVGTKVSVEGTVETYGGMLQFGSSATVTTGDKGEVAAREATEITASNIQTVIDDKKVVYVKMSGELVKSGNYYNLNFNFDANGKSGAIDAPVADLGLDNYVGQVVDIEGWFIYTTGSGARFTVIATKVTGDTTTPRVSFSSTPAQFAAENPSEQTIAYTKANITGSVQFSIEGTNADKFSVVSSTDAEVVVKAAGDNTSGSAYTAKLVAKYNGTTLAETDLKQAAKTTGGGEGGEADFSTLTANNSYAASVTTTAGWVGENVAVQSGGDKDSGPVFQSLLGSDSNVKGMVINGKTTAVGKITSPDLTGGCGTLSFDYGIAFSENKPIDFKVEIKQGGEVVKSFDVKQESPVKFQKYSFSENVGVTGTFQIVITNNSPSASTSNKDRYTIFNIKWTGNDNGGDNPGTGGDTKGTYTSQDAFVPVGEGVTVTSNPATIDGSLINSDKSATGFKVGTSSKGGTFTSAAVGVSGNKTLGFYAWAWKGKKATLYVKVEGGGTISGATSIELAANDGVTGNPPFVAIANDDEQNYYTVQIEGLTASSTISFSTVDTFDTASSSNGRAVVCGIQLF